MPEGVVDAPEQPSVLLGDRTDLGRSQVDGPADDVVGLVDYQQEAFSRTPERLGAEVPVGRRFVLHPKRCPVGSELADDVLMVVGATEAVDLLRPECRLVEIDGLSTPADRELCLDRRLAVGAGHADSLPSRAPMTTTAHAPMNGISQRLPADAAKGTGIDADIDREPAICALIDLGFGDAGYGPV
jgi:hypothetical protein